MCGGVFVQVVSTFQAFDAVDIAHEVQDESVRDLLVEPTDEVVVGYAQSVQSAGAQSKNLRGSRTETCDTTWISLVEMASRLLCGVTCEVI